MNLRLPLLGLFLLGFGLSACDAQPIDAPISASAEIPACIPADQEPDIAQVVHIADGDTITVEIDGERYRVRYIGINTPELDSNEDGLAQDAKALNSLLVEDQTVQLYRDTSDVDQYDRLLRYVMVDDTFVNYELAAQGAARVKNYQPDTACSDLLFQAQDQAQANDLGIWAP